MNVSLLLRSAIVKGMMILKNLGGKKALNQFLQFRTYGYGTAY